MNKNQLLRTVVRNQYMISTINLSLSYFSRAFETMVFKCDETGKVTDWIELDCLRSHSESEAFADHNSLVIKWGAPC